MPTTAVDATPEKELPSGSATPGVDLQSKDGGATSEEDGQTIETAPPPASPRNVHGVKWVLVGESLPEKISLY
jgi:hypothetical protein